MTAIRISNTARAILTLAASREDRWVRPPNLPIAAARQVVRSLLNHGLVEEVTRVGGDPSDTWRTTADGTAVVLKATDAGLTAIGEAVVPEAEAPGQDAIAAFTQAVTAVLAQEGCNETILEAAEAQTMINDGFANGRDAALVAGDILAWLAELEEEAEAKAEADSDGEGAPTAAHSGTPRPTLRQAAEAVLAAWDNAAIRPAGLDASITALRTALGDRPRRIAAQSPRQPRADTKQAQVLRMLRRPEGATVAQIAEAMGWAPHTVRGFFAGLKKRQGIVVAAAERVRQVGPNQQGAKGSYTIYRIAEVG
jgi:DNA-binding NarL/FixJ family response regulator